MPPINKYLCDQCGLALPSGWGGYLYVINDAGERIVCPHPGEGFTIAKVLGSDASPETVRARIGFNSYCLCCDCLHQFEADIVDESRNVWRDYYGTVVGRDPRRCPACGSSLVRTVWELVGRPCPKCETGTIVEVETGVVT